MPWECLIKEKALENVRADRREAASVEKYSISEQALYFEGKYLPLTEVRSLRVQPSVYRPHHSCGRGLPVFKIRLDYGAEKPLVLMLEKEKNAEKAVALIKAANPAVIVEEYHVPGTGSKIPL